MSELFNIKKVEIKKLSVKKLGIWGIAFLFGTVAFISGFNINSYAASSSTILPISRGGTGQNNLADVNVGSATKLQTARTINGTLFDGTANIAPGGRWNDLQVCPDYTDGNNNFIYLKFRDINDDTGTNNGGGQYDIKISGSTNAGAIQYNIDFASKDSVGAIKKLIWFSGMSVNSPLLPAYAKINTVLYFRLPPVFSLTAGACRTIHWFSTKPANIISTTNRIMSQVTDTSEKEQLQALTWNYFEQPQGVFPTPTPTAAFTPTPAPT
ncbi:MAG: hypothetical protein LBT91_00850 [Bifidobacteriaceae bacterium]|jgi:hypothetical protein|nr:hypothetical protein [Bifidobacteriaceae bacterium]